MVVDAWPLLVAQRKERGIAFNVGLTDAEVAIAEGRFGFRLPPDLEIIRVRRLLLKADRPQECGWQR